MLLRRRKLQCLFSRSGEDQGRRVVFFEDEICWSKAYCRHNFLVTCCILRNTTSDCAVILFNPVFKRYLFFAALGRMEMPVRQTFIWFVLLLAFVVNGPNLKLTRRFCFPLHAPTFYLRSVLKHQAIHWRKCVWSVTCRRSLQKLHLCTSPPWGCVEQTFAHISSMRLCGTNVCAHLLNQAVWNKLLRTSPWGCVEQTFAHISSMRLCGTNFCAHLLHEAVWNKLLHTSPPWGCVEQTFAHISSFQILIMNLITRFQVDVQLIISFRVSRLILSTSSRNFVTAPWLHAVDGCPFVRWSSRSSCPSLNLWKHSEDTHTGEIFISLNSLKHLLVPSRVFLGFK